MNENTPVWSGFIHPGTILEQVRNTAPFLFVDLPPSPGIRPSSCGAGPEGFLDILAAVPALSRTAAALSREETLRDYFALCLAAHHATVATFVPTDVDTKIRGLLWRESRDAAVLRPMADLALAMHGWGLDRVSRRLCAVNGKPPVSGHDGEWFSVIAGALGRFLALGDHEYAARMEAAIDEELRREAAAFEFALRTPGLEIAALQLAMLLAHNLGDLDQGISFWEPRGAARDAMEQTRARFGRLAHENTKPYGGIFQVAARLYRENLAAEGHRHYPLRAVRPLRQSTGLLLPLAPFLDDWGAVIGTDAGLTTEDRAEVLDALVKGCRKVANQSGYYRAIAGFEQAAPRAFEDVAARMPAASRKELRAPEMRRRVAIPRRSFESTLIKKVAALR